LIIKIEKYKGKIKIKAEIKFLLIFYSKIFRLCKFVKFLSQVDMLNNSDIIETKLTFNESSQPQLKDGLQGIESLSKKSFYVKKTFQKRVKILKEQQNLNNKV